MRALLIFFLYTLSLPVFSQKSDTLLILPGSHVLQSNLLTNYKASYEIYRLKDGEEKLIGSLDDHFQIDKQMGGQALRVCKIVFGTNQILDSGLCILNGLVPIYHRSLQSTKTIDLKFGKEKVEGKILFKSETDPKAEVIDYKTPSPLFDSYYEDILAMTIHLKPGVLFRFAEYIYERGGIVWSAGELLKSENKNERRIRFYELNSKRETVRTTTYILQANTREILQRTYELGAIKIIMKKRTS